MARLCLGDNPSASRCEWVAFVTGCVIFFAGRERTRAHGSPELVLHDLHDAGGLLIIEESQRQTADGENLVGAKAVVDLAGLVIDIDDFVEAGAGFGSKSVSQRGTALLEDWLPFAAGEA